MVPYNYNTIISMPVNYFEVRAGADTGFSERGGGGDGHKGGGG